MQAFIAALELFSGGSDRVNSEQLVGLTDEHRDVLARRAGTLMTSRAPGGANASGVRTLTAATSPIHGATRTSARAGTVATEPSSRGLVIGIVVALVLIAAGAAAVFLR
jgi:hypothetical protein